MLSCAAYGQSQTSGPLCPRRSLPKGARARGWVRGICGERTDRIQLSLVLLVKRLAVTLLEAVGLIGMHDT